MKSKKSMVPLKSVIPSKSESSAKPVSGRRTYSSQIKREAVELVESEGVSVAVAARRWGVDQTLLRTWKVIFQS